MDIKSKRRHILELCSETEYGSWEFWSDPKSAEQGKLIIETIEQLVNEKKIYPIEFTNGSKDGTYKKVTLDIKRLKDEIVKSLISIVNPDTFYWFIATDEGREEDIHERV